MLKITIIASDEETVTLRLEGRIVGEWVHELRRECEKNLKERRRVILDLSGVTFGDHQGIKVLKALTGDGVQFTGCSLFLSALLEAED
ncbi:STAS domain-containing protein [Acidobacteria bacterium AH-259-D05]|nr:STAS domain-containing protein [Acidobacteria bacterium AH-259-D05]